VYIRAFQHATNLDESAEDKILVGDRPKQNRDPLKLKARLVSRRKEDLEEVRIFNPSLDDI
jgi:N-terminal acetyltransferase B complex non-catalytic subunit